MTMPAVTIDFARQFFQRHKDAANKIIAQGPEADPKAYTEALEWLQEAEETHAEFEQWVQTEANAPTKAKKPKKNKQAKKGGAA